MPLYRRKIKQDDGTFILSKYHEYKFIIKGKKFTGSTKQTDERLAEQYEKIQYDKAWDSIMLGKKQDCAVLLNDEIEAYFKAIRHESPKKVAGIKNAFRHMQVFLKTVFKEKEILFIDLTPSIIEDYRLYLQDQGLQKNSVNRFLNPFRGWYKDRWKKLRYEYKMPEVMPFENAFTYDEEDFKRKAVLTPEWKAKFLNHFKPYMLKIVKFAIQTGLRQGQIIGLKWIHIDYPQSTIIAPKSKGKNDRPIHMTPEAKEILQSLPHHSEYVFCNTDGSPLSACGFVRTQWNKARKESGLMEIMPKFVFHSLRHQFGSDALAAGIHPKIVQEQLGHEDINTTNDYSHSLPNFEREQMKRFPATIELKIVA